MNNDDIDFPELPEKIHLSDYDGDDRYQTNETNSEFQTASLLPVTLETNDQKVDEKDFEDYNLNNLDKKVLINELSDCSLYLKNIHKGFAFVGSTNSLIKLVMAGIGVHKHRRQVLKELKSTNKKTLDFDENGNPVL